MCVLIQDNFLSVGQGTDKGNQGDFSPPVISFGNFEPVVDDYPNSQLFHDFPNQCLVVRLSLLDLSTREFPFQGERSQVASLGNQNSAIFFDNGTGNRYNQFLRYFRHLFEYFRCKSKVYLKVYHFRNENFGECTW